MRCLTVLLACSWFLLAAQSHESRVYAPQPPSGEERYSRSFADAKSWEKRELERIMRLRIIHAGARPLGPCPPTVVSIKVLRLHHPLVR